MREILGTEEADNTNFRGKSLSMPAATQLIAELKRFGEIFISSPLLLDLIPLENLIQLPDGPSKVSGGDRATYERTNDVSQGPL
jgi:hypothetical protein